MKTLITKNFLQSTQKLDKKNQEIVYSIFSKFEFLSKNEIASLFSPKMLYPTDKKIYEIKINQKLPLRLYFTYEVNENEEKLILLDVIKKTAILNGSNVLNTLINLTKI